MTDKNRKILTRINEYADQVLEGIDPQKVQISYQLEKLKPVMEEIAKEEGCPVEDIFMLYMDLASEASVEREKKFQSTMGNMNTYGDVMP
ncbi:MAG: hypothetical protein J6B10_00480 [Lachnospiraceae bacterium]|nr:hypothetical protein [Lachnospiraceae bacterium]